MGIDSLLTNGWQVVQEVSLQSVLLAATLGAFLWLFRMRHPELRHRAWLGLTVGWLIWPLVVVGMPRLEIPWYSVSPSEVPGTSLSATSLLLSVPEEAGTTLSGIGLLGTPLSPPVSEMPGTLSWRLGLAWLYGLGVAVLWTRLLLGWTAVRALRRNSTPIDDVRLRSLMIHIIGRRGATTDLRLAPTLDVPACFGWRRPIVFLPTTFSSWSVGKQEAVLAHECHHIRRADSVSQVLALVLRSLYWFHPLAWWLPKHMSRLAERACDAGAVGLSASPHRYARYLLEVAALARPSGRPGLAHSIVGRRDLEVRVRALLDRRTPQSHRTPRWTLAWTAALCLAVMGVAASELVPKEPSPLAADSSQNVADSVSRPSAEPSLGDDVGAVGIGVAVEARIPRVAWPETPTGVNPSGATPSGVTPSGVSPSIAALDPLPRPSLRLAALETPQRPEPLRRRQDVTRRATESAAGRQVIVLFDDKYRVSSLRRSWRHRSWDRIVPALNQDLMQWFGVALEEGDRVAVLSHHGRRLRLHQDLTSEPRRWAAALGEVARWQGPASTAAADEAGPSLDAELDTVRGRGGSSLEQALLDLAAAAGRLPGQTSVVLVSSRFVGDHVAMDGDDVRLRPSRFEAGHQRILDAFSRHRTPIQLLDPWRVGKRGMRADPLFPADVPEAADTGLSPSSV